MRLFFTGGGGAGNAAIYALLGEVHTCFFGDADKSAIDPNIPLDRHVQIPMANDEAFVPAMVRVCKELEIDILVPGVDEELPHMPAIAAALSEMHVLIPDASFVDTMMDKFQSAYALAHAGLNSPATALFADRDKIGYPCIIKPRSGRGSRGVRIIRSEQEAQAHLCLLGGDADGLIAQQLAEGTEYTVTVIANQDAQLSAIVPVRVPLKRQISIRAETCTNAAIETYCENVQRHFGVRGVFNVQLIVDDNGGIWPFEINPRVSTTLCLVIRAGIDPFTTFLESSTQRQHFTSGVTLRRFWRNVFE